MKYDFPYDHVTLHAFEYLYRYERKNFLKIDELKAFHKSIIKRFIDSYKNTEEYIIVGEGEEAHYEKCLISCDISFNKYDEDNELDRFLKKYRRYFKISDDTIYFDGKRGEEELVYQYWELQDEDLRPVWGRFCRLFEETDVLRSLGVHTIEDFLRNYIRVENDIRCAYHDFVVSNDCERFETAVAKKMLLRTIFMNNISSLDDYFRSPFRKLAEVLAHDYDGCGHFEGQGFLFTTNGTRRNAEFLAYLKTIDIIEYVIKVGIRDARAKSGSRSSNLGEKFLKRHNLQMKIRQFSGDFDDDEEFLIDDDSSTLDVLARQVNNHDNDSEYDDIVESLDTILRSIFTSGKEPSSAEDFGTQYGFHLLYLDKLNKYMAEYGETDGLLKTKSELLYLLDRGDNFIYKEENFKRELETFMSLATPEDYKVNLYYHKGQAYSLFCSDEDREGILSDNAVKYAINFATQYELTHDEKMRDSLKKYQDNKDYPLICKIIFGEEKAQKKVPKK